MPDPNAPVPIPDSTSGRVYYPTPVPAAGAPTTAPDSSSGRVYYPTQTSNSPPPPDPDTQPLPAIWNKPADQSWDDAILQHLTRPFKGIGQASADVGRIVADTYTMGTGDRTAAAATTGSPSDWLGGSVLQAEQAKTEAAKARQGPMTYPDEMLAYMLPGPADLAAPGKIAAATLPYINEATGVARNTAMEAAPLINKVIARATGAGVQGGAVAGAQDIGHSIYDPATVAKDVATGAGWSGAMTGVADSLTGGARALKDWWTGRPSGSPAEISATTAASGNPDAAQHALTFEQWQQNHEITGEPVSAPEVERYANANYGENKGDWPQALVNIYNAANSASRVPGAIARGAANLFGAGGQAFGHYIGMVDPTFHAVAGLPAQYVADRTGVAVGSAINKSAQDARIQNAITDAYPSMTGMNSTGRGSPNAFADAWRKLMLTPSSTP